MSTEIGVYLGIGRFNKGTISAYSHEWSLSSKIGEIGGSDGYETVKVANSLVEIGELPDIDALIQKRHEELVKAEQERHASRMKELQNHFKAA